jgi:hypothetical protein
MNVEDELNVLQEQSEPLERLIRLFAASLDPPVLQTYPGGGGFRYGSPDRRHFCLLKAARALSDFNACVELARRVCTGNKRAPPNDGRMSEAC